MMKNVLPLLVLSCLAGAARADDDPTQYGAPDCRVGKLVPAPGNGTVRWSGACKDGHAEGTGVLEWTTTDGVARRLEGKLVHGVVSGEAKLKVGDQFSYIGSLANGYPDGEGYLKYSDGLQYEGGIRMMQREGKGVQIYPNGDVYQGEFHADRLQGQGRYTYALGGAVEGEFRDDHPVAGARITYAGSGYKGVLDKATYKNAQTFQRNFRQRDSEPELGTLMPRTVVDSALPTNVGWDALTVAQKELVRHAYPALEEGDDPPYPVNGAASVFKVAYIAVGRYNARGILRMNVLVGADGQAKEVRRIGAFDDDAIHYVAGAAMKLRYKPAMCRGQPCEMVYPIMIDFTGQP